MKPAPRERRKSRWAELRVINPKMHVDPAAVKEQRLFPYYAGFSSAFAENLIDSMILKPESVVLDPWNGSGTTTSAARKYGLQSIGVDLNPVMVLVAKASQVSALDVSSLLPLAHAIVESISVGIEPAIHHDPLGNWFMPQTAKSIRQIDIEINRALVSHQEYVHLDKAKSLQDLSSIAAFFYVALFRSVRRHSASFLTSNPTWTRKPDANDRMRVSKAILLQSFLSEVKKMAGRVSGILLEDGQAMQIRLANAEALPLKSASVDAVVSSPPYCTRIDYAVATSIELAILRVGETQFDELRRALTGTSTVNKESGKINSLWGKSCTSFLESVYEHPSRASKTYYFKNHLQYFHSLYESIGELGRVLKPNAFCALVVQNSYYKERMNDVAEVVIEMGETVGLKIRRREDFATGRSMSGINAGAKKYLEKRVSIESVLCFSKA